MVALRPREAGWRKSVTELVHPLLLCDMPVGVSPVDLGGSIFASVRMHTLLQEVESGELSQVKPISSFTYIAAASPSLARHVVPVLLLQYKVEVPHKDREAGFRRKNELGYLPQG